MNGTWQQSENNFNGATLARVWRNGLWAIRRTVSVPSRGFHVYRDGRWCTCAPTLTAAIDYAEGYVS